MYFPCLLPSRIPQSVGRMKFLFAWARMVKRFASLNCDGIRHQVIEDPVLSITRQDMGPVWGTCRPEMALEVEGGWLQCRIIPRGGPDRGPRADVLRHHPRVIILRTVIEEVLVRCRWRQAKSISRGSNQVRYLKIGTKAPNLAR